MGLAGQVAHSPINDRGTFGKSVSLKCHLNLKRCADIGRTLVSTNHLGPPTQTRNSGKHPHTLLCVTADISYDRGEYACL